MLSVLVSQGLALGVYAALLGGMAYGRPPTRGRGPGTGPTVAAGGSRGLEALWLGSIAVVGLYPILVLLFPSRILAAPWALGFPADSIVQGIGFLLVLIAAVLVGWAFRSLGRFATVEIRLSQDHTIVREGPYARIRHPMYTANMLLSFGVALTFLSAVMLVPFLLIVGLAVMRARNEEALFRASPELGPSYASYVTETGRFLPLAACPRRSAP